MNVPFGVSDMIATSGSASTCGCDLSQVDYNHDGGLLATGGLKAGYFICFPHENTHRETGPQSFKLIVH